MMQDFKEVAMQEVRFAMPKLATVSLCGMVSMHRCRCGAQLQRALRKPQNAEYNVFTKYKKQSVSFLRTPPSQ
jgi:hypothetical protein